jgi:type I restriction enzyme R subunit
MEAKAAPCGLIAEARLADRIAPRMTKPPAQLHAQRDRLLGKAAWMDETIIEIIISEAQNEVADFKKWGFDIIPTARPDEAGL